MNQISIPNNVITMTSMEIVDVINELREDDAAEMLHKNFMVKLEKHPGIDSAKFLAQYKDSTGRTLKCYRLPKRESELMVMSESLAVQARVYDRMTALESRHAAQLPDFTNPATAARAWADAVELAQAKTVQLAIAAPKVAALDRIASADGSMCITNAAKALKMQPKRLFAWLSECKWIYRRAGGKSWVAYQDRIQAGLLGHDVTVLEKGDGSEKAVTSIFVTAKGLAKLAGVFSK